MIKFTHLRNSFGNFNRTWRSEHISHVDRMIRLKELLEKYFPKNIGLEQNSSSIIITFYNKEDNDYFKVLSSDGFEI